jgi:hypothetical protein
MNIRFLKSLAALVFLGLCVSGPAFAGKDKDCPGPHPSCGGGPGGGDGEAELYDVTITQPGRVTGGGVRWEYNGRSIDYPANDPPVGMTGSLDLSYFVDYFGRGDGNKGTLCFSNSGGSLHTAGVGKHKGSDAHGKFWFWGYTHTGAPTQVLYLLIVDGHFFGDPKGWPENGLANEMHMEDWELKVENVGEETASRSCEGSGSSVSDEDRFMTVFVKPSS